MPMTAVLVRRTADLSAMAAWRAVPVALVRLSWPGGFRPLPHALHGALWSALGPDGTRAHATGTPPFAIRRIGDGQVELGVWGRLGETLLDRIAVRGLIFGGEIMPVRVHVARADAAGPDAPAPAGDTATVRLLSPAVFRWGGHSFSTFDPVLFWRSLMARWRAVTGDRLPDGTARRLAALAAADADTFPSARVVQLGGRSERVAGFAGLVRLDLSVMGRSDRELAARLLALAGYAGIGARTAFGMGAADVSFGGR